MSRLFQGYWKVSCIAILWFGTGENYRVSFELWPVAIGQSLSPSSFSKLFATS